MLRSAVGQTLLLGIPLFVSDTPIQGNRDVREIRKSLPVIAMIESWIFDERLSEIKALYHSTRDTTEASNDRFVIEVDLSVHPIELNMYTLRDYSRISGIGSPDTFGDGIADLITISKDSPYDLVAVKVRPGRRCYSLFSPAAALRIAFGWTAGIHGGRSIRHHPRAIEP